MSDMHRVLQIITLSLYKNSKGDIFIVTKRGKAVRR